MGNPSVPNTFGVGTNYTKQHWMVSRLGPLFPRQVTGNARSMASRPALGMKRGDVEIVNYWISNPRARRVKPFNQCINE